MTKKIGELKNTSLEKINTTDLQKEVEVGKLPLILGIEKEPLNYTPIEWVKENQEICVSEITRVLNLLDNAEWWYALSQVKADDGTMLIRITIAPPETHQLEVLEDKISGIKKISIHKK